MKESVACRLQQSLATLTLNEPLITIKKKEKTHRLFLPFSFVCSLVAFILLIASRSCVAALEENEDEEEEEEALLLQLHSNRR